MVYLLSACSDSSNDISTIKSNKVKETRIITPIPEHHGQDPDIADLGEALFHDPNLSSDGTLSCASCHSLETGGVDNLLVSPGVNKQIGIINTPTVLNSRYNFKQFWDGRPETLEQQAGLPITNPIEMGNNWPDVITYVTRNYQKDFDAHYDGIISSNTISQALAVYERTLITPNSRFDQFIKGDKSILNSNEVKGWQKFQNLGCISCHQGKNIGGNMFQSFGLASDYFSDRGHVKEADFGRYNVTKKEDDRHRFKVPSLRNIELTAPYFHDGSVYDLKEAIKTMAYYQLGIELDSETINHLHAFLLTLTGEQPKPPSSSPQSGSKS